MAFFLSKENVPGKLERVLDRSTFDGTLFFLRKRAIIFLERVLRLFF
jgi:hypothetical protein